MSGIVGLLGVGGGAAGTQFAAPTSANIANPTNPQQLATANNATQNTMGAQQGLLAVLQNQGGISNQSNVYNQMQGTANQYQNIANGTGPNPALAQLNQTTAQNVAQTGALMAGQRGAGANVGLMARQAGQQGAATQQQAAGQAATMAAQQQLAGLSGLQTQQQNLAGLAGTQASNQIGQTNANTQAAQAQQANLMGAQAGVNTANVGMQSNINSNNAQLANMQMQGQQSMIGGIMNGASSLMGAEGGDVSNAPPSDGVDFGDFKGSSDLGGNAPINASVPTFGADAAAEKSSGSGGGGGLMSLMALMAGGGDASLGMRASPMSAQNAPQSSFGQFLKSSASNQSAPPAMAEGGLAASGGKVHAKSESQKAVKSGDSYSNDKIPAMLSEHEIVIPRRVTMGKDPINDAAKFVAAIVAKRRNKS